MVGQTCLFSKQGEWPVLNRFGWATKKEQWKVAQPLPQPRARNLETCSGQVNEQDECMFLKLPGEIRNLIYEYLFRPCWGIVEVPTFQEEETTPNISSPRVSFSVERRASQDSQRDTSSGQPSLSMTAKSNPAGPVHPLSFLLTCRKINMEASAFAFKVHPFLLSPKITTFYILHQKSQILPRLLFESITHLAFDLGDPSRNSASDFLTNSILLFPAVKTLDIVVERSAIRPYIAHPNGIKINPHQDLYDDAVHRYVPIWLRSALKNTTDGHSFAWQKGKKWQIEYGLFDSESFLVSKCWNTDTEQFMTRGFVESDFIDKVEGLVACACRCGHPNWVTAKLVQETGRTVDVKAVFLKPKERIVDSTGLKVKLIPHVEPLPVEVVQHGSGIIWGGNEDFWIDARARKGDLRAMIQSFWRSKLRVELKREVVLRKVMT